MTTSPSWLSRAGSAVVRFLLLLAGLVFGLSALLAGAFLAVVVALVGLVQGRRPTLRTAGGARGDFTFGSAGRRPAARRPEVIDIDVREVEEPVRPPEPLKPGRADIDRA